MIIINYSKIRMHIIYSLKQNSKTKDFSLISMILFVWKWDVARLTCNKNKQEVRKQNVRVV